MREARIVVVDQDQDAFHQLPDSGNVLPTLAPQLQQTNEKQHTKQIT